MLLGMKPGDMVQVEGFTDSEGVYRELSGASLRREVSKADLKNGAYYTKTLDGVLAVICVRTGREPETGRMPAPVQRKKAEMCVSHLGPWAEVNSETPGFLVCTRHTHSEFPQDSLAGAIAGLFDGEPVGSFLHLTGYDLGPNAKHKERHLTDWAHRTRAAISTIHAKQVAWFESRKRGGVLTIIKTG
jgi:hypothetical protein